MINFVKAKKKIYSIEQIQKKFQILCLFNPLNSLINNFINTMKSQTLIAVLLLVLCDSALTQNVCTDCYRQDANNESTFLCFGKQCQAFYWPKNSPLPQNLECKLNAQGTPQNDCFYLSGLDPTRQFYKFISVAHTYAQNHQQTIEFTYETQRDKVIITADLQSNIYEGQVLSHPDITFADVQQALRSKQYKIVTKSAETLKIRVGFYNIEFKNKIIKSVQEFRLSISDLTAKLAVQTQKNNDSERIYRERGNEVTTQNSKITNVLQKIANLQQVNQEFRQQMAKQFRKISDLQGVVNMQRTQIESFAKSISQFNSKHNFYDQVDNQLKTRVFNVQRKNNDLQSILRLSRNNIEKVDQKLHTVTYQQSVLGEFRNSIVQNVKNVEQRAKITQNTIKQHKQNFHTMSKRIFEAVKNITVNGTITVKDNEGNKNAAISSSLNHFLQQLSCALQIHCTYEQFVQNFSFQQFHQYSKVATLPQDGQTIESLFGNKNVTKMELLYRASENRFSASKFHRKCDSIPNTLVLVETEYGKKIGGFTPLVWDGTKNGEYKGDESAESFVFSITNRDKLTLKEQDKAIWNHINYGPIFGVGADVFICDEAHIKNLSYTNIIQSYVSENYQKEDGASFERFCGNPNNSSHFRVKEWEVWRVEFAKEDLVEPVNETVSESGNQALNQL